MFFLIVKYNYKLEMRGKCLEIVINNINVRIHYHHHHHVACPMDVAVSMSDLRYYKWRTFLHVVLMSVFGWMGKELWR